MDEGLARRAFLLGTAGVGASSLLGCKPVPPGAPTSPSSSVANGTMGRRQVGSLEVSSLGLGCQNTTRTYQNTVPVRPELEAPRRR